MLFAEAGGIVTDNLEKYLSQVYRFSMRLTRNRDLADDLTHDVFVRALEKRHQLNDARAARSWLFRIAANLWWDRQRTGKPTTTNIDKMDTSSAAVPVEEQFELHESKQNILRELNTLPERQRAVMHLYAVEELGAQEISDVLGMTRGNVRVQLHLARRALLKKLPELSGQYNKQDH